MWHLLHELCASKRASEGSLSALLNDFIFFSSSPVAERRQKKNIRQTATETCFRSFSAASPSFR